MKSFNLNDEIGFRVSTKEGEEILRKHYYEHYESHNKGVKDYIDTEWAERKGKIDNKEYIYEQAWVFMNIYGAHIGNGFFNPIETEIMLSKD